MAHMVPLTLDEMPRADTKKCPVLYGFVNFGKYQGLSSGFHSPTHRLSQLFDIRLIHADMAKILIHPKNPNNTLVKLVLEYAKIRQELGYQQ